MSLTYANLCKISKFGLKWPFTRKEWQMDIQRQLYLHISDIKTSIFADIGKKFSYTTTDVSNWCNFMDKFSQIAQKYHYKAIEISPVIEIKTNLLTYVIA